jgi:hypothetical protein
MLQQDNTVTNQHQPNLNVNYLTSFTQEQFILKLSLFGGGRTTTMRYNVSHNAQENLYPHNIVNLSIPTNQNDLTEYQAIRMTQGTIGILWLKINK